MDPHVPPSKGQPGAWGNELPLPPGVSPQQDKREKFQLSPEERIIMNEVRAEANLYRGYPMALLSMSLCFVGLKKKFPDLSHFKKGGAYLFAGVVGNIVGKVSYAPNMVQSLKQRLPHDSQLRAMLLNDSNKQHESSGDFAMQPPPQSDPLDGNSRLMPEREFDGDHFASDKTDESKFITYEQLRKEHRQAKSPPSPSVLQSPPPQDQAPYGGSRIRYNKFGDPILEEV